MKQIESWDHVASWYDQLVGGKGQYYHQNVIFPAVLSLLHLKTSEKILDLACGQGACSRFLAQKGAKVTAVDSSQSLLALAQRYKSPSIIYQKDDARTLSTLEGQTFDHVVSILALQNIDPLDGVFQRVSQLLKRGGSFVMVILHPAFRSPRITGWGTDEHRKLQYRRVDRYMSPMRIPIDMHPGAQKRHLTWTYHRPLQTYIKLGADQGLVVDALEELVSDKVSEGRNGKMENLARSEIPLFLAVSYRKSTL